MIDFVAYDYMNVCCVVFLLWQACFLGVGGIFNILFYFGGGGGGSCIATVIV